MEIQIVDHLFFKKIFKKKKWFFKKTFFLSFFLTDNGEYCLYVGPFVDNHVALLTYDDGEYCLE